MAHELAEYHRRRDFANTPEPAGRPAARGGADAEQRFVIQKHDATRLHYDLRLEAGGVLKSWAVPKGPSLDPGEKRLAVMTEDHPLEYADFEGVIGSGYGAGKVIVWDTGTYRNLHTEPIEDGLAKGHISFWLEGQKLQGGFALTRVPGRGGGRSGGEQWLLVKKKDTAADLERDPVVERPESVLSGETVESIGRDGD